MADELSATIVELAAWVELRHEVCGGGRELTVAVNRRDGEAVYLAADEMGFLAGARRFDESNGRMDGLVDTLYAGGFLTVRPVALDVPTPRRSSRQAIHDFLATLDVSWSGADRFARWCHRAGARHAFRPAAIGTQIVVAVAGMLAVFALARSGAPFELRAEPWQVPLIIAIDLVAVGIHELAHALVVVHNGRRVRSAGFRFHLGTPAFYVDSVEAMLLSRRQRIVQALAGPWAEWLVTAGLALVVLAFDARLGAFSMVLHRFVILNSLTVATNLLPFVGLDGHWLLADSIGEPDLAPRSRDAIRGLRRGRHTRRDVGLAAYAVANFIVAGALLVTAGFFWFQLFGSLFASVAGTGPLGVVALAGATAVLLRPTVTALVRHLPIDAVGVAWRRLHFRAQRRWRVEAIQNMRLLPALAGLDAGELGILAGRLERRPLRRNDIVTGHGGLYVRHGQLHGPSGRLHPGAVSPPGRTVRCARRAEVIVLPRDCR